MEILPSEWKLLNDKLTQLKNEKESIRSQTLRNINRIIVEADFLTADQKDSILDLIWSRHE